MPGLYFDSGISKGFETDLKRMNRKMNDFSNNVSNKGKSIDMSFLNVAKGLGIASIGIALTQASKEVLTFSKDLETALIEVATISKEVTGDFDGYRNAILEISKTSATGAKDITRAFYDVVSAGYDGEKGLKVLKAAETASTAGFVDMKVAADGLTTVLNAWGKSVDEAENVSDIFFKTVERGKTTFPELGANIAQVAPIASSLGVSFEEVTGAVATLTKSGTPTAQAITQIRSSLLAMTQVLGDGWSETMTYQEALEELRKRAGGSTNALRDMLGRVEAVNAVLGLTGNNAKTAAEDLQAMNKALGATSKAAEKVLNTTDQQLKILKNNILALLAPIGEFGNSLISSFAKSINSIFKGRQELLSYNQVLKEIIEGSQKSYNEQLETSSAKLNTLFERLKQTNKGSKLRSDLITQINTQYGKYLPNLLTEQSSLQEITTTQNLANESLKRNIGLKIQQEGITKIITQQQKRETEQLQTLEKGYTNQNVTINQLRTAYKDYVNNVLQGNFEVDKNGKLIRTQAKDYNEFIKSLKNVGVNTFAIENAFKELGKQYTQDKSAILELKSVYGNFIEGLDNTSEKTKILEGNLREVKRELVDTINSISLTKLPEIKNKPLPILPFEVIKESQKEVDKLQQRLNKINLTNGLNNRSFNETLNIIDNVNRLAVDLVNNFGGLDEQTKNILTGLAETGTGLINLGTGIQSVQAATTALEKASGILAIIGAVVKISSAITNTFEKMSNIREEAFVNELRQVQSINIELLKQNALYEEGNEFFAQDNWGKALKGLETYNKALDLQKQSISDLANQTELETKRIGESILQTMLDPLRGPGNVLADVRNNNQIEALKAQAKTYSSELEKALGSVVVTINERGKFAKFFGAKDEIDSLLKLYPELIQENEQLNTQLLQTILETEDLTEADKQRLQNLIDFTNEAEEAYGQFGDYISSIFGGVGDEITQAFQTMYESGTEAMGLLENSFSEMIERFTRESIEFAFLQPLITELNETTKSLGVEFAKGNISADKLQNDIVNTLGDFYNSINQIQPEILRAYENADKLAAAAGFESAFNPPEATTETIQQTEKIVEQIPQSPSLQAIQQSITEETGTELVGRLTAIMLGGERVLNVQNDMLDLAIQNLVTLGKIKENTDYLPEIANNTRRTYEKLESV